MTDFAYGDYVMYQGRDLGRVIAVHDDDNVSVCYSTGCTAGLTPVHLLAKATPEQVRANPDHKSLGFHRFDATCPEYRADICSTFCSNKH